MNWLSNEQNMITLSVIRQYSGCGNEVSGAGAPEKKPIKLTVPFVYGVDTVEGLVSVLVTLHLITEDMVEKTTEAIRIWLTTYVASMIRAENQK